MNHRRSMIGCCYLAVLVLAATADPCRAATCSQDLPTLLVTELWRKTKDLIKSLPIKDSGRLRLLPLYCTNRSVCPQVLGWSEVGHVIKVYQKRVFSNDVIKKLLPENFDVLLHRVDETLHRCAPCQKHSKRFEKKIKKALKKRRKEEVLFKAVREFLFVLRWVDELRDS